jgi:hypothetical protein
MPVALITLHTYRSWREDNARGYVQRGKAGVQPPSERLAQWRDEKAKQEPVRFNEEQRAYAIDAAADVCGRRDWRLHAASCTATHLHVIVSWREEQLLTCAGDSTGLPPGASRQQQVEHVAAKLKQLVGMLLSKREGVKGRRWFSRGIHDRWVRDREHLQRLMSEYLPRHAQEGGVVRVFD